MTLSAKHWQHNIGKARFFAAEQAGLRHSPVEGRVNHPESWVVGAGGAVVAAVAHRHAQRLEHLVEDCRRLLLGVPRQDVVRVALSHDTRVGRRVAYQFNSRDGISAALGKHKI